MRIVGGAVAERKIVVGVDGSAASVEALRWAVHQATFTGAALEAIFAWESPYLYDDPLLGAPPVAQGGQSSDEGLENARSRLDQIIDETVENAAAISVHRKVVDGHPAPALLAAAEGADLLVVGGSGHGAFVGMLLGSVSNHVIAHAPCPVVVVRGAKTGG